MKNITTSLLYCLLACVGALSISLPVAATEKITYLHTDMLNSVVAASDTAGKVLWHRDHKPYGDKVDIIGSSEGEDIAYTGKHIEKDTGLINFGRRWYDPEIGRFVSVDPVDYLGHFSAGNTVHGFNRYAYGNNNPYRYVDPDGRESQSIFRTLMDTFNPRVEVKLGKFLEARLSEGKGLEVVGKVDITGFKADLSSSGLGRITLGEGTKGSITFTREELLSAGIEVGPFRSEIRKGKGDFDAILVTSFKFDPVDKISVRATTEVKFNFKKDVFPEGTFFGDGARGGLFGIERVHAGEKVAVPQRGETN